MEKKTIKQIANELNITTQAIYHKINNSMKTQLRKHVKKEGGQTLVDEIGFNLIRDSLQSLQTIENDLQNEDEINITIKNDVENKVDEIENVLQNLQDIENTETIFKTADIDMMNNYISSLKEQISILKEQNKILLQESNKNRESLEQEREVLERERAHSREQSDKLMSLAEQLTELNKNNQVLLREAQEKMAILLPGKFENNNSDDTEKKQGFFKKRFGKTKS